GWALPEWTGSAAIRGRGCARAGVFLMWLWAAFIVFILFLLVLDLGVFHRKAHVITLKEALTWSGVWIGVALVFNVFIYFAYQYHWFGLDIPEAEPDGRTAAVQFFTGYIVEKSLGMD